jgi:hypothetical protein
MCILPVRISYCKETYLMKRKSSFGALLAAAACALFIFSAPAMHADTIYDLTTTGSVDASGTIDLNFTAGTITVTLTNLTNLDLSNPSGDGSLIAGLFFTLDTTPGSASLLSQSGALVNVPTGSNKTTTSVSGSPNHWGAKNYGSTICLETAGGDGSQNCAVGGKPADLILTDESMYHVNNSVVEHQSSIDGTGTFVIDVPGLTSDTTILSDSALVVYGTSGDTEAATITLQTPPPPPVPEPGSLLLTGTGILSAAFALRRRMLQSFRF